MSDTPRTDAVTVKHLEELCWPRKPDPLKYDLAATVEAKHYRELREHASTLERGLAAAREYAEQLRGLIEKTRTTHAEWATLIPALTPAIESIDAHYRAALSKNPSPSGIATEDETDSRGARPQVGLGPVGVGPDDNADAQRYRGLISRFGRSTSPHMDGTWQFSISAQCGRASSFDEAVDARLKERGFEVTGKEGVQRDGWQLVPKQPTIAMQEACDGILARDDLASCGWVAFYGAVADAYRAMLAAAPAPVEGNGRG